MSVCTINEYSYLPDDRVAATPRHAVQRALVARHGCIDAARTSRRSWLVAATLIMALGCGRIGFESFESENRLWGDLGDPTAADGIVNACVQVRTTRLAVNARDEIVVAWTDTHSGNEDVYLSQWTGSQWQGIGRSLGSGGISADVGESLTGSIAFDAAGRPAIVWRAAATDGGSPRSVYVRQWNGEDWSELAGSASGRGISIDHNPWWPTMIADSDNQLVVAWETYNVPGAGGGVIHMRRFNGDDWVELAGSASAGGVSEGLGNAQGVSMAAGSDGTVAVAWADDREGSRNVYLRQWDGSDWRDVGDSHTGGGISQSSVESSRVHVALADAGVLVVAWLERAGGPDEAIYLRQWDGVAWRELDGSASGVGVSGTSLPAYNPDLAVDSQGNPVVVWQSQASGIDNVHARRWDGAAWEDLNLEGGVSDTPRASTWPVVAVDSRDRIIVAWEEEVAADRCQVYVRRYE